MKAMARNPKTKATWAEDKIATSKSLVEAHDEFERGCSNFIMTGRCGACRCGTCIMQTRYNETVNRLKNGITISINGNITINGNVTIN